MGNTKIKNILKKYGLGRFGPVIPSRNFDLSMTTSQWLTHLHITEIVADLIPKWLVTFGILLNLRILFVKSIYFGNIM